MTILEIIDLLLDTQHQLAALEQLMTSHEKSDGKDEKYYLMLADKLFYQKELQLLQKRLDGPK